MGSLYIQEPSTYGKVVLNTTVGDIDIELWSRETPTACRNFVQLCLENYYDGTIFHRVVKGFIAQGGDPNGDGTGGESVYGKPFKDEFHSRLRFVRRGLVALANGGKDDNGSQFFFTFAACPELQNKNTIFGKVSGDTLYNMLKLEECLVNEDDRPLYPHKIISSKVLLNPFPDVFPRVKCNSNEFHEITPVKEKLKEKNYNLLSFGEEAEEEENEVGVVVLAFKGKSKSSHDLSGDPKLSSVSAAALYVNTEEANPEHLDHIRKKLRLEKPVLQVNGLCSSDQGLNKDKDSNENDSKHKDSNARENVKMMIKNLVKELKSKNKGHDSHNDEKLETEKEQLKKAPLNPLHAEYQKQTEVYIEKSKLIPTDGEERQKQTMELLAKFKVKLETVKLSGSAEINGSTIKKFENDEREDDSWLIHSLHFGDNEVVAKDANMHSGDWYDITDPRNSINQRRRQQKK